MNLPVVALNGGMPVGRDAIRASCVVVIEDGAKYHVMSDADVLRPLADVVPVPPPFVVVLSIGDVLPYGGMAWWCSSSGVDGSARTYDSRLADSWCIEGGTLQSGTGPRLDIGGLRQELLLMQRFGGSARDRRPTCRPREHFERSTHLRVFALRDAGI